MMTPSELREYEFKGAGRNAYKSDDVDNFFGEVAVAYEKIFRENAELIKRVSLLADRLEKFKHDEEQIKQAVIGAQKAADIIVKEAEQSVEDSKEEAEAILAAAKGEAEIIKSDAEKQAIADSDLLLSIARDKAEAIINKAKEEAHGIIIKANNSAKDTVGAATRTITSESLHYEMLKKEVSEFRASILSQYKAHIEMISKLPELAVEEAEKKEEAAEAEQIVADENIVDEIASVDPENDIIEFIGDADEDSEVIVDSSEELQKEEVVKTTLPYDFFEENSTLEFVDEENSADEEIKEADVDNSLTEAVQDEKAAEAESESSLTENLSQVVSEAKEDKADIPISKGFTVTALNDEDNISVPAENVGTQSSMFTSFETIDEEDELYIAEEPKKKKGFFHRKK